LNGLLLVSSFGFVLLFSVVSGFLFYKNWWRNLFRLRLHKGPKAFWSDLHRFTGVWTLIFALLIAVTCIWYFVEEVITMNCKLPSESAPRLSVRKLTEVGPHPQNAAIELLVANALRAFPNLDVRTIWFPMAGNELIRLDGQARAWLVRDRANQVFLDPYSADV